MISAVGFAQLNALENLGGIMSTAVSILGDIDHGIDKLNHGMDKLNKGVKKLNATAIEAVEQLEDISRAMGMLVIINQEIRDQLRAVNDTLNKPVTVKARDLWNIAERCRQAGDIESAVAKFLESQKEDPSFYKNYYSLALACLELSMVDAAEDFLLQAQAYAKQSGNKTEREVLHLLGKLEFMTHRLPQALEHLYLAYGKDPNDFTVWYDIALTEMLLGDKNAALGFLKALAKVAKAKSPGYMSKIKSEPIFASILNDLSI
jgi:tetratricopeptide (TPR) repeat protein